MDVQIIEQKTGTALEAAQKMEITDTDTYVFSGGFAIGLKALENEIIGAFEPVVKAAYVAHKEAIAARDRYLDPVASARKIIWEKIGAFVLAADAEFEAASRKAAKAGELAVSTLPKVDGISVREVWKFEVIDAAKVPKKYLAPDERMIGGVVRSLKGNAAIPGVKVWMEKSVAVGTGD